MARHQLVGMAVKGSTVQRLIAQQVSDGVTLKGCTHPGCGGDIITRAYTAMGSCGVERICLQCGRVPSESETVVMNYGHGQH